MKIRGLIFGRPKDLHDPHLFHKLSLVAFFAWVGLGADGLSSSAYGPEEAFKVIGEHYWLALPLILMTGATVAIIAAGYYRIIEYFPFGGGGYVVAKQLLGEKVGLVSSSALVIDYVLTIAISISSGADALFSFLPPAWHDFKMPVILAAISLLTWGNLRGTKESVAVLTPIFLTFILTHLILIFGSIGLHLGDIPATFTSTQENAQASLSSLGWFGALMILLRAYSMGGGTYTGIEAVSNGLAIMREPKVRTGQRTMVYMATSLAIVAAGILFAYLLYRVTPVEGKTLNAVLAERFADEWAPAGLPLGKVFVFLVLVSEAALLFVAAQAGFIAGPRVMANMANDSWFPHRFAALSESLTMHYGVMLMSAAAIATVWYTDGNVSHLVVMYSINVFITFSLSEIGMTRYTRKHLKGRPQYWGDLFIFTLGAIVCVFILVVTVYEKFLEGGWVTLLVTGGLIGLCTLIRRHYNAVGKELSKLDKILEELPTIHWQQAPTSLDRTKPTAVLLVGGYSGIGIHSLLSIQRTFPGQFENFVFLSVGVIDTATFQGVEEVNRVEARTKEALERYVDLARGLGLAAEWRMTLGTEAVEAATELCVQVAKEFSHVVFFAGKLIFHQETWFQRLLHNETALAIQNRLHLRGLKMVVLPITVEEATREV